VVFQEDVLTQYRSGNQSVASRILSIASNEGIRVGEGEKVETQRREYEWRTEWEPCGTARKQLAQPKGQDWLQCLDGVNSLDEVLTVAPLLDSRADGVGTTVVGTGIRVMFRAEERGGNPLSNSGVHRPAGLDPWPDQVPYTVL